MGKGKEKQTRHRSSHCGPSSGSNHLYRFKDIDDLNDIFPQKEWIHALQYTKMKGVSTLMASQLGAAISFTMSLAALLKLIKSDGKISHEGAAKLVIEALIEASFLDPLYSDWDKGEQYNKYAVQLFDRLLLWTTEHESNFGAEYNECVDEFSEYEKDDAKRIEGIAQGLHECLLEWERKNRIRTSGKDWIKRIDRERNWG